jgi:hypothetical protein
LTCLELSPDKRPASAFEVKNQLEQVAKKMGLKLADLHGAEEDE